MEKWKFLFVILWKVFSSYTFIYMALVLFCISEIDKEDLIGNIHIVIAYGIAALLYQSEKEKF